MNLKHPRLAFIILGTSFCLTAAADDEAKLMQANPGWHFTTEVYTNPPYELVPTNVWFRLGPLSNGKWAWTTNQQATWFGLDEEGSVRMDSERAGKISTEWNIKRRKQWLASLPPDVANVEEYRSTRSFDADIVNSLWQGVWAEDTNTGWRVLVRFFTNNEPAIMSICVGSRATNSGTGLLRSPDGQYARLQLIDASGKVVPSKKGAALKLYEAYPIFSEPLTDAQWNEYCIGLHLPSAWDASVERVYPETLSDLEFPRWRVNAYGHQGGSYIHFAGFTSNGPPCHIGNIYFNDIFAIKTAGDYTVTVQPVLYRMHNEAGTFQGYLDRVDLPSVTTKVHLVPSSAR